MAVARMEIRPPSFGPLPAEPLFSVLISSYNYEHYVGAAIQSVLDQTYRHCEVIVCDDGSSDGSCAVIKDYARRDPRVKLLRKANGGQASALNEAYRLAGGDLVGWLDSDDQWYPQRLARVVDAFRRCPDAGTVTHMVRAVQTGGRVVMDYAPRRPASGWLAPAILGGESPIFPALCGSLRREVAELVFPLPEVTPAYADRFMHARAALVAPVAALQEVLGTWHIHGHNHSQPGRLATLAEAEAWEEMVLLTAADLAAFAGSRLGLQLEDRVVQAWVSDELREHRLLLAFLQGQHLARHEIADLARGRRYWPWLLLFRLPRPLARQLLARWRQAGPLRRWGRRLVPLSPW